MWLISFRAVRRYVIRAWWFTLPLLCTLAAVEVGVIGVYLRRGWAAFAVGAISGAVWMVWTCDRFRVSQITAGMARPTGRSEPARDSTTVPAAASMKGACRCHRG